jgi:diacylglycerol O-acyltransferase / wax synthase
MTGEADRLSADDARILALESAVLAGHTMKLIVLAPGTPIDLAALRLAVAARLATEPRSLERVETGPDGAPRWVQVASVDIEAHVRRREGAQGGGREELRRVVGALMSEHLDRSRPLWTLDVIGPLADGREAIVARMHHAMVDGIAGIRFIEAILLDPHDAPVHDVGTRAADTRPSGRDEWRRVPSALGRELGRPGSASPFDKRITAARELGYVAAPLDGLREIGASRPVHATINDVLLAVVAGGLHSWLGSRGHRDLRAQVPVSLHRRDEGADELGNRDSFINVDLSLEEHDPLRRLDRISAHTRTEKQLADAAVLYDVFHALARVRPADEVLTRIAGSSREFSVAVSNVPGPRVPVAVAGRRVDGLYSFAEPAAHHALRIAAVSHAGEMGIGFCTDPSAVPGVGSLADAVEESYRRLHEAALRGTP